MIKGWINIIASGTLLLCGCKSKNPPDGLSVENEILTENHLSRDFASFPVFQDILKDVNCADSVVLGKKLVFADSFHSWDTTEILLIPYISNGKTFKSSAYSDVE